MRTCGTSLHPQTTNDSKRARTTLTHHKLQEKTPIHMNGSFVFSTNAFKAIKKPFGCFGQPDLTQLGRARGRPHQQ